jgi:hypothetical protein
VVLTKEMTLFDIYMLRVTQGHSVDLKEYKEIRELE